MFFLGLMIIEFTGKDPGKMQKPNIQTLHFNIHFYISFAYIYFPKLVNSKSILIKSDLKPVLLLHSPFLLPSFFRREEKKGKK